MSCVSAVIRVALNGVDVLRRWLCGSVVGSVGLIWPFYRCEIEVTIWNPALQLTRKMVNFVSISSSRGRLAIQRVGISEDNVAVRALIEAMKWGNTFNPRCGV